MGSQEEACRLCGLKRKLCRSHIIPELAFKPLYDADHRYREMPNVRKGWLRRAQKGWQERLLCAECEQAINVYESHSQDLFKSPLPEVSNTRNGRRNYVDLDHAKLKLFFLSILWRSSVSQLGFFRHVSLGPHEEILRSMIARSDPGGVDHYPVSLMALHFHGEHMRDFMVEPTYYRLQGRLLYRLVIAGFLVQVAVTSHPLPAKFHGLFIHPERAPHSFDTEFLAVRFLREVWNLAILTAGDRDV